MKSCWRGVLCAVLLVIALVMAPVLEAKQEQVLTRGFDANKAYTFGDVDAVDTMNGHLTARVPLGGAYSSNGSLTYAFALTYNSNHWDWNYVSVGTLIRQFKLTIWGVMWYADLITDGDLPQNANGMESYPSASSNAGLGWTITLGELRGGYTYVGPDGSEHPFQTKLSGNYPDVDDGRVDATAPLYTRDGSFLKLTKISSTERMVEFPNGLRQRFICGEADANDCNGGADAQWLLDEMADPYGNLLYIDRVPARRPAPNSDWTWTFKQVSAPANGDTAYYARRSDVATLVRSHTLKFRVTKSYEMRLASASLAASGGPAVYSFEYDDRDIYRDYGSLWGGSPMRAPFNDAGKVDVSMLSKVNLPANGGNWAFDYIDVQPGSPGADLVQVVWNNTLVYKTSKRDGHLRSLTLPTGGRIEYEYTPRAIPARHCGSKHGEDAGQGVLAVSRRSVYDKGATAPAAEWRYFSTRFRSPTAPVNTCNFPKELMSTVVGPEQTCAQNQRCLPVDVSFYSVYWDNQNANDGQPWDPTEYGLPVTKAAHDGAETVGPATRWLSTQTYQCPAGTFASNADEQLKRLVAHHRIPGETATCGNPVKSTYVRYENSGLDCTGEIAGDCTQAIRRVASSNEVYHGSGQANDPDTSATIDYSDYDGLGHYRRSVTGGNIFKTIFPSQGMAGSDERRTYTNYNPDIIYDPATHAIGPQLPARWLLELYDTQQVRESPNGDYSRPENVATIESYFHPDTGFLKRTRTLSGTTDAGASRGRTAGDLLVLYQRTSLDALTTRVTESYYGGDGQQRLSTNKHIKDWTALDLPGFDPEYTIEKQLRHGAPLLTRYMGCGGGTVVYTVENNTVDAASGLILNATANSGETSHLAYDALGRLTSLAPHNLAVLSYTYTPVTSSAGATATMTSGAGLEAVESKYEYDSFGRVVVTRSRVPDDESGQACGSLGGCWNYQRTAYFGNGRKDYESVVMGHTPSDSEVLKKTVFQQYDVFGRELAVQAPDGATTKVTYFGTWHKHTEVPTLGAVDEYFDRHGRRVKMTAGSDPAYRYEYDSSDRLRAVYNITGTDVLRSSFAYDNRGFLTAETHPELNHPRLGQSWIKYTYDSRGNALTREYASPGKATTYDLAFEYDAAERLTKVWHGKTEVKRLSYYPAGAAALSTGKLSAVERLNLVGAPLATDADGVDDYWVREDYKYSPDTGLMTDVATFCEKTGFAARVRYGYDGFGHLTAIQYPHLCDANAPCSRSVTRTYRQGLLRAVPGWLPEIHYHPNGLVRKTVHANGAFDELLLGEDGMERPAGISFYKSFNSQAFGRFSPIEYNGAGNIKTVTRLSGVDSYFYDDVGRIKTATVQGQSQSFDYDGYGNMNQMTTAGAVRNLATDPSSNQLQAAGYDAFGFMISAPDLRNPSAPTRFTFAYDALGMINKVSASGLGRYFLYNGSDERVAILDYVNDKQTWSMRDNSHRVLSDFVKSGTSPISRSRDYIYASNNVAASVEIKPDNTEAVTHLHVDHLGTPRVFTNSAQAVVLRRDYWPFGEEIIEHVGEGRVEFTGHERDDDGTDSNGGGDFDHMHARYYAPWLGRFLSVDPETAPGRNLYAYAANNPIVNVDPDGRAERGKIAKIAKKTMQGIGRIFREPLTFVDFLGYLTAYPMLEMGSAIIEGGDAKRFAIGYAMIAVQAAAPPLAQEGKAWVVEKIAERNFQRAIRSVNPLGGNMNCGACAQAGAATLEGRAAEATVVIAGQSMTLNEVAVAFPGNNGWFKPINGRWGVEEFMYDAGNGTQSIVYLKADGGGGHFINVINQDGTLRWIDFQLGIELGSDWTLPQGLSVSDFFPLP